ncbi:MAG: GNAT family N-acetyltransferase [Verrucomicrobia bacterium]|jgi:GNAT superfamily N-acetyltransferase|nr:GNAT family N-acetyltransferase [Verrucomicrobiota bacterium]
MLRLLLDAERGMLASGMTPPPSNLRLVMIRPHWDGLPAGELLAGWSLRWYQPGDAAHWTRIHLAAEREHAITDSLFRAQFGHEDTLLAVRQCYLLTPDGEPVGTATAWFDDSFADGRWGRVHWVALTPAYQGRGLAKPLLAAVCQRLRELGHDRAFLRTTPTRRPAIQLYLRFGFQPHPRHAEETRAWQWLAPQLKYPVGPIGQR